MIIKVCGMRDAENIRQVASLGIDWMGFIFYPASPRAVGGRTEAIGGDLPVKKTGVFVNASVEEILRIAEQCRLDMIQLHGNETPAECSRLQANGYQVVKAFRVSSEKSFEEVKRYAGCADYFLFDTPCETYGGSGLRFDWSALAAYRGETPFLLSGGIGPEQAEEIRRFHHPRFAGIDLNSRFEVSPGRKDVEKLSAFIQLIRK